MSVTGILVHARHLDTIGWEGLMWGKPQIDSLGSLPTLVELLLFEPADQPINTVIFGCGPSQKDGLRESEYAKKYLLEHLHQLVEYPRFATLQDKTKLDAMRERLERGIAMEITATPMRTIDEIREAVRIFAEHGVAKVVQITSASHGPRCVQLQSKARADGIIPATQRWFVRPDDRCYTGAKPLSTGVFEPPHKIGDATLNISPSMAEVLQPYHYDLTLAQRQELIQLISDFMKRTQAK